MGQTFTTFIKSFQHLVNIRWNRVRYLRWRSGSCVERLLSYNGRNAF